MNDSSLKSEETKKEKIEVVALPVWLGTRFYDYSDLHAFSQEYSWRGTFQSYLMEVFPEIDLRSGYGKSYLPRLKKIIGDIEKSVNNSEYQTAIFFILTARAAESKWYKPLMKIIKRKVPPQCRIYKIVMGGGFEDMRCSFEEAKPYWPHEIRCHQLGAVYSYFNSDAPSNAAHRLVELINRIMGCDLPDKKFPDYSFNDLKKIAWNISRENFNTFGARDGAIPKYKIKNGRPVFPF